MYTEEKIMDTEEKINDETHDIRICAEKDWWLRFDSWLRKHGCRSRAEGVRLAIELVREGGCQR